MALALAGVLRTLTTAGALGWATSCSTGEPGQTTKPEYVEAHKQALDVPTELLQVSDSPWEMTLPFPLAGHHSHPTDVGNFPYYII